MAAALPVNDDENSKMVVAETPRNTHTVCCESLLKQLECPLCRGCCSPPISQCENGHNICSSCRVNLQLCPTCGENISFERNRFAEQISMTYYPCPNQAGGCRQMLTLRYYRMHMSECAHLAQMVVQCFHTVRSMDNRMVFVQCRWAGLPRQLLRHVKVAHPTGWRKGSDNVFSYKLRKKHIMLVNAFNHMFWSYMRYDYTTLDMRGAVFPVTKLKPHNRFSFQYHFQTNECSIFKRGIIGGSDCHYNSTIFQGIRMLEQFVDADKIVTCRMTIEKLM